MIYNRFEILVPAETISEKCLAWIYFETVKKCSPNAFLGELPVGTPKHLSATMPNRPLIREKKIMGVLTLKTYSYYHILYII